MASKDIVTKRGIYLYINGQQINNDIKSVRAEMSKLVNSQAKMVIGSEEYIRAGRKIQALKGIQEQHRREWALTGNEVDNAKNKMLSFGKAADVFNRYFGMITAFIASLTGATFAVRKFVDSFAELEETEADVRKYTGMTREEVKDLGVAFQKMDTRTARTELNKLAADAGRLGKKTKDDVLDFVDAANIIKISLGEDLGEDAVKNIGKLSDMFGFSKEKGLRQGMLSTASAINELAQNSSAAEPYLLNFTARMAGTGKQANISMMQIMGYASVLDQDMQQVEMSATALQTVVIKMFQEPAKFAKMAGMNVKEFARLMKEDANEALLQLLSNLQSKGDFSQLAPAFKEMGLDGVRASGVLSNLAANVDKIRHEQELATKAFNEGTSATSEYSVKNTTLQAEIDKAKKKFQEYAYVLGEKLAPHMSGLVSKSGMLVKMLSVSFDFLMKYGIGIARTTVLLLSYIAAQKIYVMWQGRTNTVTAATIALNNLLKLSIAALSVVWNLLAGNAYAARRAMVAFNAIVKLNPFAVWITVITGAIMAITHFISKTREANKYTRQMREEMLQEETAANRLFTALKMAGQGTDQRRRLIEELNTKYGEYLPNLLTEETSLNDIRTAQEAVNTAIRTNIALKTQKEAVVAIETEGLKKQAKEIEDIRGILSERLPQSEVEKALSHIVEQSELAIQKGKKTHEAYKDLYQSLQHNFFGGKKWTEIHTANYMTISVWFIKLPEILPGKKRSMIRLSLSQNLQMFYLKW